ncbi:MAG: hypothetical protein V9E99_17515 [Microthrixaceae bacterium]
MTSLVRWKTILSSFAFLSPKMLPAHVSLRTSTTVPVSGDSADSSLNGPLPIVAPLVPQPVVLPTRAKSSLLIGENAGNDTIAGKSAFGDASVTFRVIASSSATIESRVVIEPSNSLSPSLTYVRR